MTKIKIRFYFSVFAIVLIFGMAYGSMNIQKLVIPGYQSALLTQKEFFYRFATSEFKLSQIASVFNGGWRTEDFEYISKKHQAHAIPVLVYHGIGESVDRFTFSPEGFFDHMNALKREGYSTISLEQFRDWMISGKDVPERSIVVTFDDGRRDSFIEAEPILRALEFRATMFIATGFSLNKRFENSPYYLNTREVAKMIESGRWEVHSHGIQKYGGMIDTDVGKGNFLSSKRLLNDFGRMETDIEYAERVHSELYDSKRDIEETLSNKVFAFSYPFGDYGQQTKENSIAEPTIRSTLIESGYRIAFRQTWENEAEYSWNSRNDDPFLLKRIEPSPSWSGSDLISFLAVGETKLLPLSDSFAVNKGWRREWGNMEISNNVLRVVASTTTTGGSTFLDGTQHWKNYRGTVEVVNDPLGSISLVARYGDAGEGVQCTFDEFGVRIVERDQDVRVVIAEQSSKGTYIPKHGDMLGIATLDDRVVCEVNGIGIVGTTTSRTVAGGFGISVWNKEKGVATLALRSFSAEQVSELAIPVVSASEAEEVNNDRKEEEGKEDVGQVSSGGVSPEVVLPAQPDVVAPEEVVVNEPLPVSPPLSLLDGVPHVVDVADPLPWELISGTISATSDGLRFQPISTSNAMIATLIGSQEWKDYEIRTKVRLENGTTTSVVVRYQDKNNYMECAFSKGARYGSATLYVIENGTRTALFRSPRLIFSGETPTADIGVRAKGTEVSCLFNGYPAITYELPRVWRSGAVGVRLWDSLKGHAQTDVLEMKVTSLSR